MLRFGAVEWGLWTRMVRECTAGLHMPEGQTFVYMQAVYGCEVVGIDQVLSRGGGVVEKYVSRRLERVTAPRC